MVVLFQRLQIPLLGGGWLLRPSTMCGGTFSSAGCGTATPAATRFLGGEVEDLIAFSPEYSGCFVQVAGSFVCFLFFSGLFVICTEYSEYMYRILFKKN